MSAPDPIQARAQAIAAELQQRAGCRGTFAVRFGSGQEIGKTCIEMGETIGDMCSWCLMRVAADQLREAAAPLPAQADPRDLDEQPTQSWAVTVARNGEEVVTIADRSLAGRAISDEDARVIRMAAEHLRSFVGKPEAAAPLRITQEQEGGLSDRAVGYMKSDMAMTEPETDQEQNWILSHLVTFAHRALESAEARETTLRAALRLTRTRDEHCQNCQIDDCRQCSDLRALTVQARCAALGDERNPPSSTDKDTEIATLRSELELARSLSPDVIPAAGSPRSPQPEGDQHHD